MKYRFFFLSVLFGFLVQAQEFKISFIKKVPLKADVFYGVDAFANTYYSSNNILYKKTSGKTYQFNSLALGAISSVSINNPLEIVIFYKDFNTVIILDNTLNIIQKLAFLDKNISLVAKADKNKLWLFNTDVQQLELYDYKTETVVSKSQPQSLLNPKELKANANFAWIKTNSNTIKILNNYGSTIKIINKKVDNYVVYGINKILFNKEATLFFAEETLQNITLEKISKIDNLSVTNNKIYIFSANSIFMYALLKN